VGKVVGQPQLRQLLPLLTCVFSILPWYSATKFVPNNTSDKLAAQHGARPTPPQSWHIIVSSQPFEQAHDSLLSLYVVFCPTGWHKFGKSAYSPEFDKFTTSILSTSP
jgi:hypothetical protein